jgi:hypothetical protein
MKSYTNKDSFLQGVDSSIILTSWITWKEHNSWVFQGSTSPTAQFMNMVKQKMELWIAGRAKDHGHLLLREQDLDQQCF